MMLGITMLWESLPAHVIQPDSQPAQLAQPAQPTKPAHPFDTCPHLMKIPVWRSRVKVHFFACIDTQMAWAQASCGLAKSDLSRCCIWLCDSMLFVSVLFPD